MVASTNVWAEYERRKRLLQAKNLTPEEYERAIVKLCRELKI